MKIVILANNDVGLYKFRRELLEELIKENEVYICLPNGEFVKDMVNMGTKFIPCELLDRHGTNPFKELKLISFYKRVLKEYTPDIVLTYTIKPNVYGGMACNKYKIPYVANITGLGTAVENEGIMQKITLALYKKGLKSAQKVFFQNRENQDFMLRHNVVSGKYDLLPGSGVNLNQYTVMEYPKKDTIDFVFIARVMKEKGINQFLDAAKYIRKKYPNTCFHVCGACEQDYQEVLDKLSKQGIIQYHGLVKDITAIHRISSCTIHPTYYPEGLSNVLLESCACGRPIITTNRAGCREVVDDGVNGFVIKEKDSQDLIKKIEEFLALPYEARMKMGLAGRKKVEKEYSRQIVIDKYMREIEESR